MVRQAELARSSWTALTPVAPDKIGAVGRPHPGVDIKLATDGRLLVRPPNTAVGIAERVDADGFVDTGDLARIDDDGFVWIEGRVGDLINRGGNKVCPDAVEEVLGLSPAVDDVAVVPVPTPGWASAGGVWCPSVPYDELAALFRAHLAATRCPWLPLGDALPRSDVGKVLRRPGPFPPPIESQKRHGPSPVDSAEQHTIPPCWLASRTDPQVPTSRCGETFSAARVA